MEDVWAECVRDLDKRIASFTDLLKEIPQLMALAWRVDTSWQRGLILKELNAACNDREHLLSQIEDIKKHREAAKDSGYAVGLAKLVRKVGNVLIGSLI
jgi:hypothetical protein